MLGNVMQTAEKAVLGAEFASITACSRPRTLNTVSGNAHGARGLDELQERFGQGPVVEATRADGTVMASSPNLAEKSAWPELGPHAAKEGVRNVSCAGMFESQGSGTGAVSVYSREPRGLAAARPDVGLLLASYAATALAGTKAASGEELARFRIQEPLRSVNALERAAHVLIRKRHRTAEDAYDVLAGHRTKYGPQGEAARDRRASPQVERFDQYCPAIARGASGGSLPDDHDGGGQLACTAQR